MRRTIRACVVAASALSAITGAVGVSAPAQAAASPQREAIQDSMARFENLLGRNSHPSSANLAGIGLKQVSEPVAQQSDKLDIWSPGVYVRDGLPGVYFSVSKFQAKRHLDGENIGAVGTGEPPKEGTGGSDGFSTLYNGQIVDHASKLMLCPLNEGCRSEGFKISNSFDAAAFSFQDSHRPMWEGFTDHPWKGGTWKKVPFWRSNDVGYLVNAFSLPRESAQKCVTTKSAYGHTWEKTRITGVTRGWNFQVGLGKDSASFGYGKVDGNTWEYVERSWEAASSSAEICGKDHQPQPRPTPPQQPQPGGKYYVQTFAAAPGASTPGGARTGTLNAGRNYVFCKVRGPKVQVGSDYNHWWLKTDLDSGNPSKGQYVSAYYLKGWGNDVAKDVNGTEIPNC